MAWVRRCIAFPRRRFASHVPDQALGRVNATWQFIVVGVQPLGALLGGELAAGFGLRASIVVSSLGMLLAALWPARSPLRWLREIPSSATA